MNALRKCFVETGQQYQKLGPRCFETLPGHAEERTRLVDRVNNNPMSREKRHLVSFECERMQASHLFAVLEFLSAQDDRGVYIDQLICPLVDNPELKLCDASVRGNDGIVAEQDLRFWPRKSRKEETRD